LARCDEHHGKSCGVSRHADLRGTNQPWAMREADMVRTERLRKRK